MAANVLVVGARDGCGIELFGEGKFRGDGIEAEDDGVAGNALFEGGENGSSGS